MSDEAKVFIVIILVIFGIILGVREAVIYDQKYSQPIIKDGYIWIPPSKGHWEKLDEVNQ